MKISLKPYPCSFKGYNQYKANPIKTIHAMLGMVLAISSSLLLSACEPQTGETLVSSERGLDLNAIDIDLERPTEIDNIADEIKVLPLSCRNKVIIEAFSQQKSNVQVKGCGKVTEILADDLQGSRHQRFIVQLDGIEPSHTVLIAHNIDLAPKVEALNYGDDVVFYGQYEYNQQGGVVHWTHHDPAARHQNGWIEHQGQRFQ